MRLAHNTSWPVNVCKHFSVLQAPVTQEAQKRQQQCGNKQSLEQDFCSLVIQAERHAKIARWLNPAERQGLRLSETTSDFLKR